MLATSIFLGLASVVLAQTPTLTPPPAAGPTAVAPAPVDVPDPLKSTYPAIPLVSKTFAYPSGIVSDLQIFYNAFLSWRFYVALQSRYR